MGQTDFNVVHVLLYFQCFNIYTEHPNVTKVYMTLTFTYTLISYGVFHGHQSVTVCLLKYYSELFQSRLASGDLNSRTWETSAWEIT